MLDHQSTEPEEPDDYLNPTPGDPVRPGEPRTVKELKDYIFKLVLDARIRDEVGSIVLLLRGRGFVGSRIFQWVEHAALAARGKKTPEHYFRSVVLSMLEKGGTPAELARKARPVRTGPGEAPGVPDGPTPDRLAFDEALRLQSLAWTHASREVRAEVLRLALTLHGPADRWNEFVYEGICIGIHNRIGSSY